MLAVSVKTKKKEKCSFYPTRSTSIRDSTDSRQVKIEMDVLIATTLHFPPSITQFALKILNSILIGEEFENRELHSPTSTLCTTVVGKHKLNRIPGAAPDDQHVSCSSLYITNHRSQCRT